MYIFESTSLYKPTESVLTFTIIYSSFDAESCALTIMMDFIKVHHKVCETMGV